MSKINDFKFKKDKLNFIKQLLDRNDLTGIEANMRALLRIYQLQTASEKVIEHTVEYNGVGFTGYDGEFMTSLAKQFISKESISSKQFRCVKKAMKKYSGQLLKIHLNEIDCKDIENFVPDNPVKTWVRSPLAY